MTRLRPPWPAPAPWLLLAALLGPAATPAPAPAATPEVDNLRVGFGERNQFRLGAWTPVRVEVRGGDDPGRFAGFLEVAVPDDDGVETVVRQRFEVGPGERRRVVAYARPGSREVDFAIRFVDDQGRRVGRETRASNRMSYDVLPTIEDLILTLGNPQGVDMLPRLPGFGAGPSGVSQGYLVARVDLLDDQLPGRWIGYDSARAVVLDVNDRQAMEALAGGRAEALARWVRAGGHLVVAGSSGWQRLVDSALADALPALPAGQVTLQAGDLRALESFASSSIQVPGTERVQVAKLEQVDRRRGKVLSAVGGVPLIVRGAHGFGRVTLVGVDVDQRPFAEWEDRALFWTRALDLPRPSTLNNPAGMPGFAGGGAIFVSGVNDYSTALKRGLERFPGVRLIPFGWVAFFIFAYIVLIGPGDYLFLRKVLKRMELTWVTFPAIVLSVSLTAYFAAYEVKGTDLRVNKVDVVDVDQEADLSRGRTWANVFSPQNRDYDVAVRPLDLSSDPDRPARLEGAEATTTWFGVAEPGFGGMGGGTRMGFAAGGYAYAPDGSAESLSGVRIPIWSTKAFSGSWVGPGFAVAEADLEPVGTDRLNGTITNRLGRPLRDAVLAFNTQVYDLGTIAPGATVRVELTPNRTLSGYLRSLRPAAGRANRPGAPAEATAVGSAELVRILLFQEVIGGEPVLGNQPLSNQVLGGLDLSGQLRLDRPMLVARVDGAASELDLGGAADPAKASQTTTLRAILPLRRDDGDAR